MADDTNVSQNNESAPLGESQETSEQQEQFVSKATTVADDIETKVEEDGVINEVVNEMLEEETEDEDEEYEPEEDTDYDSEPDEEELSEEDIENLSDEELESLIEEIESEEDEDYEDEEDSSDNKDGFMKGLDKVKQQRDEALKEAEALKEELLALKEGAKEPEKEKSKAEEKPISQAELTEAIGKFMDEGDSAGVMDVFNYMLDERDKKLMGKYDAAEKQKIQNIVDKDIEWQTIRKEYSPEMYKNETLKKNPEFDINNNNSALYQLADKIYMEGVKKKQTRYVNKGGMMAAVEDAFLHLVKSLVSGSPKKGKAPKGSEETEGLMNRLAKEQRKKSVNSGKSSSGEKSKKQQEVTDDLDDYMAERKLDRQSKLGIPI